MLPEMMAKLQRLCAVVLLGTLLTACMGGERETDRAAREGILLMGIGTEPKTLDPHLATGIPENRIIIALLEGLIGYHLTDDLEPEPGMAESWEHNPNFTQWTFTLRSDARWTNGDPVTAQDFVYSWQRILNPALGSQYAEMLYVLKGAEGFHQGQVSDFSQVGVKALGAHTLQVQLEGPTPHFLSMLKHYSFFPVNPRVVEAHGGMTDRQSGWSTLENYVGNGPFRLTQWSTNQLIEVERNADYWDDDAVRLNAIRFYPIENVNTEETLFRNGRLHLTGSVNSEKIAYFREIMPDRIITTPYLGSYFYRINVTRKPFDDPRVRRALALAIDKQLLVDRVTKGGQAAATGYVPEGIPGYAASQAIQYDPARARALLAEAGYPGGKGFPSVEILINTSEGHRKIAEAVQAMWRDTLGVEIGIYNQEWKVYLDSQSSLDYDISRAGWIGDYVYPMTFLDMFTTGNGNNNTGWSNARYDALIRQARTAEGADQRMGLMQEAEGILLEDLPVIPIYWYTSTFLKDPRLRGWESKLLDNHPYKQLWLEAEAP